jgi:hypothetical protein
MIITHHHPIARGRTPPPVMLHRWPGESFSTNIHLGLLICRDVSLYLLTGVGPWYPR